MPEIYIKGDKNELKSKQPPKAVKPNMVMNVICLIFVTAVFTAPFIIVRPIYMMDLPAQSEKVEVMSKRIRENYVSGMAEMEEENRDTKL